jgi:hypothetical protein
LENPNFKPKTKQFKKDFSERRKRKSLSALALEGTIKEVQGFKSFVCKLRA